MSSKLRGQKSLEDNNLVTTQTLMNHNKLGLSPPATINNAYIVVQHEDQDHKKQDGKRMKMSN
jgi:hypothetical protein